MVDSNTCSVLCTQFLLPKVPCHWFYVDTDPGVLFILYNRSYICTKQSEEKYSFETMVTDRYVTNPGVLFIFIVEIIYVETN